MKTVTWRMVVDAAADSLGVPVAECIAAIKQPLNPAGMRDEFAIAALQSPQLVPQGHLMLNYSAVACAAYRLADAMLEVRNPPAPVPVESIAGYEATTGVVRHVLVRAGLKENLDVAVRDVVQSLIDKGLV